MSMELWAFYRWTNENNPITWQDAIICPYYLKTGTCKYGTTCKFDHPPPGEVMAMAAIQSVPGKDGEERIDESVNEQQ